MVLCKHWLFNFHPILVQPHRASFSGRENDRGAQRSLKVRHTFVCQLSKSQMIYFWGNNAVQIWSVINKGDSLGLLVDSYFRLAISTATFAVSKTILYSISFL